jgi:DNA-binding NarL/FixJ family response regulator
MTRVFILFDFPLFGQGIERLLRRQTRLEVVGQETDENIGIKRIAELHPDIVIVGNGDPASDVTAILRILKIEPPIKVIALDRKVNRLYLYHREEREVRNVENLMDAINGQLPSTTRAA